MNAGLILSLILPGIGLLQVGLMLLHAWEHRRYHARRWTSRINPAAEQLSVALVAPCKGLDADLRTNLLALFRQWYPQYELCFVVESEDDPAISVIQHVARENPQIPSRIVTAGLAHDCGQKVHNLMKAVETILSVSCDPTRPPLPPLPNFEVAPSSAMRGGDGETGRPGDGETWRWGGGTINLLVSPSPSLPLPCSPTERATSKLPKGGISSGPPDILAFVDSDACPHTEWLARLVERLASGKHAVATGYRWYVPAKGGNSPWANRLLSAINNTVIGVMGPHGFNLVWGGAWAIRAEDFKKLGLPAAWKGSLSDDLVVSRLVHEAGLKVAYEPNCLVKSTADFDWSKLGEFLRRQFVVVRVYAPLWWWFGFCTGLVTNVCFWGTPVLACILAANNGPWAVPVFGGLLWYLEGVARAQMASRAIRPFVVVSKGEYRRVSRVNVWGWPLVSLATWLAIISGTIGRTITWRGIRYRLDSPTHTTILETGIPATGTDRDERHSHARTTTRAA